MDRISSERRLPMRMSLRTLLIASVVTGTWACNPAPPRPGISDQCRAEVHNGTSVALAITVFGRDKVELGRLEPGASVTFTDLCRVERVPVRGAATDANTGLAPIWEVVTLRVGETVRARLEGF